MIGRNPQKWSIHEGDEEEARTTWEISKKPSKVSTELLLLSIQRRISYKYQGSTNRATRASHGNLCFFFFFFIFFLLLRRIDTPTQNDRSRSLRFEILRAHGLKYSHRERRYLWSRLCAIARVFPTDEDIIFVHSYVTGYMERRKFRLHGNLICSWNKSNDSSKNSIVRWNESNIIIRFWNMICQKVLRPWLNCSYRKFVLSKLHTNLDFQRMILKLSMKNVTIFLYDHRITQS